MFRTSKELKAENERLKSEVTDLEGQLAEANKNADSSEKDEKITSLENENAALLNQVNDLKGQVTTSQESEAKAKEDLDKVEKAKSEEVETKSKEKVIETLAEAGADVTLTESSAKEEAAQDFQSRYEASKKAGGAEHTKFMNETRAERKAFLKNS